MKVSAIGAVQTDRIPSCGIFKRAPGWHGLNINSRSIDCNSAVILLLRASTTAGFLATHSGPRVFRKGRAMSSSGISRFETGFTGFKPGPASIFNCPKKFVSQSVSEFHVGSL
jgi:hypothetical protein